MNWIYPEKLPALLKGKLNQCYILYGNDSCLLQDTQLSISKIINAFCDTETLRINLDINTNWNKIFNFCKTKSLFSKKKILLLNFFKNYSINYFDKDISLLSSIIHNDIIIILLIYTSYPLTKYTKWVQYFNQNSIFINCITSKHTQLELWIKKQAKNMNLVIENLACQLLCYYYEGNYICLTKILQYLSLVFPDGNLSFLRIKNIINDTSLFDSNHWIESILTGKKKRANRVLKQLEHAHINWKILLYKIQHELFIIIQIKYNLVTGQSLDFLLKKYKIYEKHHRLILIKASHRFKLNQLYIIISLLVHIELQYNQHCIYLNRSYFEMITEILCDTKNLLLKKQFFIKNKK